MRKPDVEKKILRFLAKEDWPVTTEQVAKEVGISWQTAQIHLMKLAMQGRVKFKKVGRQNQWMISKTRGGKLPLLHLYV